MEKKLKVSIKNSKTNITSTQQDSFSEYSAPRGRGRGCNSINKRMLFRGSVGRSRGWNYDNSNAYQQNGGSNYRGGS